MAQYDRKDACKWARHHLKGVADVTIPAVTSDFTRLNERAVRHDVQPAIEHGFVGSLVCSEVAITRELYVHYCGILAQEAAGADLVLLGYPPTRDPDAAFLKGGYPE